MILAKPKFNIGDVVQVKHDPRCSFTIYLVEYRCSMESFRYSGRGFFEKYYEQDIELFKSLS